MIDLSYHKKEKKEKESNDIGFLILFMTPIIIAALFLIERGL